MTTATEDDRRLERLLLLPLVLAASCATLLVATAQTASGDTDPVRSACLTAAVDRAQAFAAVLGDRAPVDVAFAAQECRQP